MMNFICGVFLVALSMIFLYECLDSIAELKAGGLSSRYKSFLTYGTVFLFIAFVSSALIGSAFIAQGAMKERKPKTIEITMTSKTLVQPDTVVTAKDRVRDTLYLYKFTEEL